MTFSAILGAGLRDGPSCMCRDGARLAARTSLRALSSLSKDATVY